MWKLLLLVCLAAAFSGCASGGYQPGINGVRDLPQADYCTPGYGPVNNADGAANR